MPPTGEESSPRPASTSRLYRAYKSGNADQAKGMHPDDRSDARNILSEVPSLATTASANVQMLRRAVTAAALDGIDQIIDIGCDLPTEGAPPLHAVMREHHPGAHSALVDHDAYVITHATALMAQGPETTAVVEADARYPETLVERVRASGVIDFDRPVCLVMGALLHFIGEEDAQGRGPAGVVETLAEAAAPGSWVVCTHVASDLDPEAARATARWYTSLGLPGYPRPKEHLHEIMAATQLVEPGVAPVAQWRPDLHTDRYTDAEAWAYAAVGRVADTDRPGQ